MASKELYQKLAKAIHDNTSYIIEEDGPGIDVIERDQFLESLVLIFRDDPMFDKNDFIDACIDNP